MKPLSLFPISMLATNSEPVGRSGISDEMEKALDDDYHRRPTTAEGQESNSHSHGQKMYGHRHVRHFCVCYIQPWWVVTAPLTRLTIG